MISGLGKNLQAAWENVAACKSAIRPIEKVDTTALRFKNGSEVPGYNPLDYFGEKQLDLLDTFTQFSLIAAREAINHAGIELTDELKSRSAIVTGTGIGGQDSQETAFHNLYKLDKSNVPLFTIPRIMPNAGASMISMEFGITGPAYTISTACSSSNHAIGNAYWLVRNGICDMAITGGAETPFSFAYLKAWEPIRVVAPDTCRPFSKNRQGMILGEGGAMMILESLESAQKRGATIYAELVGFGMSADASHITKPNGTGAETAMKKAMEDARINTTDIDYINAHGTGTAINDSMEVTAIKNVFGEHAHKLAVSSTKSLHGHILGGTSAIEAVITAYALHKQVYPPTANFIEKDPECDIDCVPNEARGAEMNYALSNSFAFGGLNAVLAFKRWND
jgi:nodulation protein E